jgi:hypothetical protein
MKGCVKFSELVIFFVVDSGAKIKRGVARIFRSESGAVRWLLCR